MRKNLTILLAVTFLILSFTNTVWLFASDEEDTFHGGDIIYTVPLKAVLFSHKSHVEDIGIDCDACHEEIFQMESLAAQDSGNFTMKSLYKGKYCGACHDGSMAFASNTQCARCHIGVKGYNRLQESKKGE